MNNEVVANEISVEHKIVIKFIKLNIIKLPIINLIGLNIAHKLPSIKFFG